jgi:plastocyanin
MRPALLALLLPVLLACDDSASAPMEPVEEATVLTTNALTFSPASVELVAGGTITWNFNGVGHTVTFSQAQGAPSNIPLTFSTNVPRTFNTPGTYAYHCEIHTSPPMAGTIIVR